MIQGGKAAEQKAARLVTCNYAGQTLVHRNVW